MLELFQLSYDDLTFEYKNYIDETVSYFITDYLERFPYSKEIISIDLNDDIKLQIKILQIEKQSI